MKEQFIEIFNDHIKRPGASSLLAWLEKSDFFASPASTCFHLSEPGGLAKHSIHVYERLRELYSNELARNTDGPVILSDEDEEKIAICGLLHDICKVGCYKQEPRNQKTYDPEKVKKSVYIASAYIKLTREEAVAIRFHMAAWQDGEKQNAGKAFERYSLAVMLHIADLQATYLDEVEQDG